MTHRPSRCIAALTLALAVTAVSACTGDDDTEAGTSATVPVTEPTAPATDPTTTASTSSTTSTTAAPTTAVDIEALKAQIAENYVATEQAREDLTRSPSLDNLDARVRQVSAPDSFSYQRLAAFVQELAANGQRIVPGQPDYSDVVAVEAVDLADGSSDRAEVTACLVSNQARVGPDGAVIGDTGILQAARVRQPMLRTADGWRQSDQSTGLWIAEGATACPPS